MSARANTKTPEANREKRQELARLRDEANLNKQPPFSPPAGPATGPCNDPYRASNFQLALFTPGSLVAVGLRKRAGNDEDEQVTVRVTLPRISG